MEGRQVKGVESGKDEYHDIPNENLGTPGKFNGGRVRPRVTNSFQGLYGQMEADFQWEVSLKWQFKGKSGI